ncbi:transposase domain-containing protein [Paenibacillus aestuarii]|uniref:Transposase domain-containing protein n=1 Tax=Paenibacillus aestuarii TaxID=516965 RepID=A0ABW0K728_9BACL
MRYFKASAANYSIIETEKENGLHPFKYLMHLFEKLPQIEDPRDPKSLEPFVSKMKKDRF